jgi:hypothetical protein
MHGGCVVANKANSAIQSVANRASPSNLDSAISVLEAAEARLRAASPDEKRQVEERARALEADSHDAELITFLEALIENLADDADEAH